MHHTFSVRFIKNSCGQKPSLVGLLQQSILGSSSYSIRIIFYSIRRDRISSFIRDRIRTKRRCASASIIEEKPGQEGNALFEKFTIDMVCTFFSRVAKYFRRSLIVSSNSIPSMRVKFGRII